MVSSGFVVLGDVVHSRKISDDRRVQELLLEVCREVNRKFKGQILADFRILKGIDEIGGVLREGEGILEIVQMFWERLYPVTLRLAVVYGKIDVGVETRDISLMSGPAIIRASQSIEALKKADLVFHLEVSDPVVDQALSGFMNALFLIQQGWTPRERRVFQLQRRLKNQRSVAQRLGITQQAVSKILSRIHWRAVLALEHQAQSLFQKVVQTREVSHVPVG